MKLLGIVLAVQVALGITLVALVATDNLPFTGDHEADGQTPGPAAVHVDRFDGAAAFRLLRRQVELGPRPAGSAESRRLARLLKRIVPRGRYQDVPGGDFIDFIEVDDRYSYIVLGDVMGKKWVAWFFTFSFLSYIRAAIRFGIMNRDFSTAEILQKVNSVICYDNALKDILSTMSLIMIDKQEQVVSYSGAGDLPILHYKGCTGELEQVESSGLLLGLFEDGGYTEERIELKANDQLFIFTDGLIDYEDAGEKKTDYNLFKNKLSGMIAEGLNFKQIRNNLLQNLSPSLVDDCSIINIKKQ